MMAAQYLIFNAGSDAVYCILALSIERTTLIRIQYCPLDAGEATITAEYQETRPELASAQKSKQQLMRAVALAVTIFPGPVHALTLDSQPMADRLAVTNAANKHQRTLLKAASLQVGLWRLGAQRSRACHG